MKIQDLPWAIVNHRKLVSLIFLLAFLICLPLQALVTVNYDMMSYLPPDAPSTKAIKVMQDEFTSEIPNTRVLLHTNRIADIMSAKKEIAGIDGVHDILWLDDTVNVYQPLEMIDEKAKEPYMKDGYALLQMVVDEDKGTEAIADIKSIVANEKYGGADNEVSGDVVDTLNTLDSSTDEVSQIMLFAIPLVLFILIITTRSFFEPVLFLITAGFAIIINLGTNIFLGEISFVTSIATAILQLATAMDYSVFLLHRFSEFREQGMDVQNAMVNAMRKSFASVTSSGFTTIIGFAALMIMQFRIGVDLGFVLAKGIVFSLICSLILLPALTCFLHKLIEKTHHRSFLPSFRGFGKAAVKIGVPIFVMVAIVAVPAFLAQSKTEFSYGMPDTQNPSAMTDELFNKSESVVLLVPKGNSPAEAGLSTELGQQPFVNSVISYANTVSNKIPPAFLDSSIQNQFYSEHYSRIIMSVNTGSEGTAAFNAVEKMRKLASDYYPPPDSAEFSKVTNPDSLEYQLLGSPVNIYDMRSVVRVDNQNVTLISVIGIAIILLLMFKSLLLPIILLLTIEIAIWVNMSIPYFGDQSFMFIGFILVSSVQLGATVDYAILFANRYIENRETLQKREACIETISNTAASIMTSGGILALAGAILYMISSNPIIGELGVLIGRGALFSMSMVFIFLPSALILLDKPIQKLTIGLHFINKEEK
jgi:predicted RND superfamily exporter protein